MSNNWQRWKGIMKCYPFEEKRLAKWTPPYIVQPKYDGVRCRAIPLPSGEYMLLSSEENPIFSVPHINKALGELNCVKELDGELYTHNMSFEQIVSITSRTVNLHSDNNRIQFHIFDYIDNENPQPQFRRIIDLNNIDFKPPLVKSPYWVCNSLEEIMEVYNELICLSYEGIIVRNYLSFYERKRSTLIMKFKPKKEDNYIITGYEEEISKDGNPKCSLGALQCMSGDGSNFSVGTGFTRDKRKELWRNKDSLIGCTAKVKYQHITSGNKVPRFPVFVEIIKKGE